ncbi:MAG: AMP-binding protein, partial [Gammaproteobacteria bacterium]|nr:AMP-binding protein [Gammaproteobacteria bacterium]
NSEAPDLKGLKILCGGEALTPDLAGQLLKTGGEVWNLYGPTETTVWSAACRITEEPRKKGKNTSVSIGRPIANTQIYILDRRLQPVPAGVAGELYIGGAGLARGYLKRPELNANSFINQSGYFSDEPEARLYKTGDLARHLPDGRIECLGRADNQVKLRGFRIEPGEIEAALAKHPGVLQCAAIVRKDSSADDKRLTGYVVPEGEQTPSGEELRDFLKKTLPDYMVPGIFVMLEALPLTPNGKIDRRALPVPGRFHKSSKNGRVAPRDNVELQLLQIWEQVLNIHPISVRDDFFALGGHSLLAVSLMAKIQKKFGKQLPLSALFRGATVELLAAVLRRGPLPESPLAAIQPNGAKPPFFAVHPIGGNVLCYAGLARHLGPEQPFYGLQANDIKEKGNSIEEMASHYLRTLREIQPQGPYRLGGWSFGGVVAFEMARQLYEQGQETALLALIDAKIPAEQPLDIDTEKLLASLVGNLGGLHACKLHVSSAELRRLDIYKQLNLILKQAMQYHIFPPEAGPKQIYRLLVTFKACRDALCRYVPSPYPGRITLFQSSEDSKGMDWTGLAAEIKIHNIPAGHYEIIREPHVRTLALQLTACLDKV